MKKVFSVTMLIIGTIIGAGFATGRELVSFFGSSISPLTALFGGVAIFFLCVVFLTAGATIKSQNISEVNKSLAGKGHVFVDIFLLVNNFIVLAGMLAGMDSLGSSLYNLKPLYSVLSGLLCVFVVCKGIKGLLDCNRIVVPVIIITIIGVGTSSIKYGELQLPTYQASNFLVLLIYICMNMMLAGTLLTTLGEMKKSTIWVSSLIAATIMGILMLVIILALNGSPFCGDDMPVLQMARQISPFVFAVFIIVIATSIFTTMLTAMSGLVSWFTEIFHSRIFAAIVVLLAALALSNLGFSNVVGYLYPVIGVLGVCYNLLGITFALKHSAPVITCRRLLRDGIANRKSLRSSAKMQAAATKKQVP